MIQFINLHYRFLILLLLSAITLFCWIYIFFGIGMTMSAWDMTMQKYQINLSSTNMASNIKNPLNPLYTISLFLMWLIMMVAMMLPSAIPVVLMFDKISNDCEFFGDVLVTEQDNIITSDHKPGAVCHKIRCQPVISKNIGIHRVNHGKTGAVAKAIIEDMF